jgi:hypothetical protein
MENSKLKTSYGVVILPKGTILYHSSTNKLCTLPSKPVLFMTLHPSEWYSEESHISVVELQKEVSLLFMVKYIHKMRIISSLNNYLGNQNTNLAKMDYEKIKCWIPFLKKENLDGWFSSIENKTAIEFAILNDPANLKIMECLPITFNWNNSTYNNSMELVPKKWGSKYLISSLTNPVKFILNSRYKQQIEDYHKQIKEEDPEGTAFSVLLKNAEITYIDAPLEIIKWC